MNNNKSSWPIVHLPSSYKGKLSGSEQLQLCQLAKNGDEEAKLKLFLCCIKSLNKQIIKYGQSFLTPDDLVSEAYIGFQDALDKFKVKSQNTFLTYARIRIKGAMLDAIRSRTNLVKIPASSQLPYGVVSMKECKDLPSTKHFPSDIEKKDYVDKLGTYLQDILGPLDGAIMKYYFGIPKKAYNACEIADILDKPVSSIRSVIRKSLKLLRADKTMANTFKDTDNI